MNSSIHFVELDNRVITATYRNLMIKAKVVLVDTASGRPLPDPVTAISSPLPAGQLRIRLPDWSMPDSMSSRPSICTGRKWRKALRLRSLNRLK